MIRTAKPLIFIAGLAFSASMAQAITVADVVKTYQDQAYSGIEVKESPNQIKVEAAKDGVKVEVVYDKVTGDVIKHESETLAADETNSGLEVSSTDHDFTGDESADDNSATDDPESVESPEHETNDHNESDHDRSGHGGGEGNSED
ncbi:PepSY domain-containing protein [Cypionkella sp. TWP1-2-1b2]|uniref:PepSY domain-containing protein n=1 Tax=Cypionkella sp. TWP1-2-1b2 TaxID=2804675 RepID=UPI003CF44FBD